MANLKVLLVDDDALVRSGLRVILSSAGDIDVVAEVDDGTRRRGRSQGAPARRGAHGHPYAADGRHHRDDGCSPAPFAPAGHRPHHVPG